VPTFLLGIMSTLATKTFRPMLRPIRKVHVPGTPGIYNVKPNWRPGPNWQPQTPRGPWMDGWALGVIRFYFNKFLISKNCFRMFCHRCNQPIWPISISSSSQYPAQDFGCQSCWF